MVGELRKARRRGFEDDQVCGMAEQQRTLLADHKVPIIDIAHITKDLVCPVKSCTRLAAQKLHKALIEKGFALLVNHGIREHKLQGAYCKLDTFCTLPDEQKQKYVSHQDIMGYRDPGKKNIGRLHEYKHVVNIKELDESLLPEAEVPGFTKVIGSVVDDFISLAAIILQFIAIGCGLSPNYFLEHHKRLLSEEDETYFQMVYYPPMDDCKPCNEMTSVEKYDMGTFTIISQDSEIGLEILEGNKWVQIGYLPGSLLLRAGERLHKWTGGVYKPSCYRLTVPDDTNTLARSRHCSLLYVDPAKTTVIKPIDIIFKEFQPYQGQQKQYCSLIRAYHYVQRRIRQLCR